MNRIVLIGNGFDLAHELKTSYRDFIDDYWDGIYQYITNHGQAIYQDEYLSIKVNHFKDFINLIRSPKELIETIKKNQQQGSVAWSYSPSSIVECTYKNKFLGIITQRHLEKWVDVEYEYFRCMQQALKGKYLDNEVDVCKNITVLNDELKRIESLLLEYLKEKRGESEYCREIYLNVISRMSIRDISTSYIDEYIDETIRNIESEIKQNSLIDENNVSIEYQSRRKNHIKKYIRLSNPGISDIDLNGFADCFESDYVRFIDDVGTKSNIREYLQKWLLEGEHKISKIFRLPSNVMLVNFNYTDTIEKYIPDDNQDFQTIYIHGKLQEPDSVIFGYGDELCSEYKEFENSAESEFLKNVKSIKYLNTDNYRKLLEFADSDKFQVFLMGHSCGLSDRTLLNTLFEHKNCVSIKPFYYIKDDDTDDYNDIVRNISRNFTDKAMMRDRVVNKTYCTPLCSYNE